MEVGAAVGSALEVTSLGHGSGTEWLNGGGSPATLFSSYPSRGRGPASRTEGERLAGHVEVVYQPGGALV